MYLPTCYYLVVLKNVIDIHTNKTMTYWGELLL